jgi:hypothetical protein
MQELPSVFPNLSELLTIPLNNPVRFHWTLDLLSLGKLGHFLAEFLQLW